MPFLDNWGAIHEDPGDALCLGARLLERRGVADPRGVEEDEVRVEPRTNESAIQQPQPTSRPPGQVVDALRQREDLELTDVAREIARKRAP